ncbi:MAG: hypothetical protein GX442_21090 [Candidatus Riflebacteria bacterium]|nr:hypothetical protein [Candidatus Riflebacteria bacterium]
MKVNRDGRVEMRMIDETPGPGKREEVMRSLSERFLEQCLRVTQDGLRAVVNRRRVQEWWTFFQNLIKEGKAGLLDPQGLMEIVADLVALDGRPLADLPAELADLARLQARIDRRLVVPGNSDWLPC